MPFDRELSAEDRALYRAVMESVARVLADEPANLDGAQEACRQAVESFTLRRAAAAA